MADFLNRERVLLRGMPAVVRAIAVPLAILFTCPQSGPGGETRAILPPLLAGQCLGCHGNGEASGGINFESLLTDSPSEEQARLLGQAINAIDSGAMPPDVEQAPDAATRSEAIRWLQHRLGEVVHGLPTPPLPLQRLNRFHYSNTVRDLFRLSRDLFPLPEKLMTRYDSYLLAPPSPSVSPRLPDVVHVACHALEPAPGLEGVKPYPKDLRAEHGFDNQADELTLSPLLLDAFLRLAHSIVESPDFTPDAVGIWADFFAAPAEGSDREAEVRGRLKRFLRIAFRGPVEAETLDRYSAFALSKLAQGLAFPDAMKKTAAAALSSPRFLFRVTATGHDDMPLALASRLSAFLWGSCPDEELLELAERGAILHPDVLDRTVTRMLADPRIERFLDTFPSQWMQLENALAATPDPTLAHDFHLVPGAPASLQMVLEPLVLFDTVFVEERPLTELIAPSSHYQSEFLRSWYQGAQTPPAAEPDRAAHDESLRRHLRSREFRRVPCDDPRFGGIITNAAVASMTSGPKRTHPVARGVWIVEVIFNDPPSPPPADVPPLAEDAADPSLTIREHFAAHREHPSCAGCHTKLDPVGFALENYDITGRWRDGYANGRDVDASGTLFRRHAFDGAVGFKGAIVAEQERFARAFTAHLLRFALGRDLVPADRLVIDGILSRSARQGHAIKALIRGVVQSESFRDFGQSPDADAR